MSRRTAIKSGERFGDLIVIAEPFVRKGNFYVRCRCTCGEEREMRAWRLRHGTARTDCTHRPGERRRPLASLSRPAAVEAARHRCSDCGSEVIRASVRSGDVVLLELAELFARGPCPRCEGRGAIQHQTCPTCRGEQIVGVALTSSALFALGSGGRARAITPPDRRTGDALHFAHACAMTVRAAA